MEPILPKELKNNLDKSKKDDPEQLELFEYLEQMEEKTRQSC